jgi:hypothetical protein
MIPASIGNGSALMTVGDGESWVRIMRHRARIYDSASSKIGIAHVLIIWAHLSLAAGG